MRLASERGARGLKTGKHGSSARRSFSAPINPRLTRSHCQVVHAALRVALTGAAGRTGRHVLEKMLQRPDQFEPVAIVRNEQSRRELAERGVPSSSLLVADISSEASAAKLSQAFRGCEKLLICTSAVPKLKPLSLLKVFWAKHMSQEEGVRPDFEWKNGQRPEQVDWLGQKRQIDAAKVAGVRHVVLLSSMGGTTPDHALNRIGDGNILMWKRRAEQYLLDSGLIYTIIHPGGLLDEPGGLRELVIDVDDHLMQRKTRAIPREDVAELCLQCLTLKEAENRSFDVITKCKTEGTPTTDFRALLAGMPHNNDYSINSQRAPKRQTVKA